VRLLVYTHKCNDLGLKSYVAAKLLWISAVHQSWFSAAEAFLTSKTAFGRGLFVSVVQYAWFSLLGLPSLWVFFFLFLWRLSTKAEKEQVS